MYYGCLYAAKEFCITCSNCVATMYTTGEYKSCYIIYVAWKVEMVSALFDLDLSSIHSRSYVKREILLYMK